MWTRHGQGLISSALSSFLNYWHARYQWLAKDKKIRKHVTKKLFIPEPEWMEWGAFLEVAKEVSIGGSDQNMRTYFSS